MQHSETHHGIVIAGAGFGEALLGLILARNGVPVTLLDRGVHPHTAVGEDTLPYTSVLLEAAADRFNVPELKHLCSIEGLQRHVGTHCGVKKSIGFINHRLGTPRHPDEVLQFHIPGNHSEAHYFRSDVDAWLVHAAVAAGATYQGRTTLTEVARTADGVRLTTTRGVFDAAWLVDGSGPDTVTGRVQARGADTAEGGHTTYAHMVGVGRFQAGDRRVSDPHLGTTYHFLNGGRLWVTPFDNHAAGTNLLTGVGVQWDGAVPEDAEAGFRRLIAPYPELTAVFDRAKTVSGWTTRGGAPAREALVGDGWCLFNETVFGCRPFFSGSLALAVESAVFLADQLLDAYRADDFRKARFSGFQAQQEGLLHTYRSLDGCLAAAGDDFRLWSAVVRIWFLGSLMGSLRVRGRHRRFRKGAVTELVASLAQGTDLGSLYPDNRAYHRLFEAMVMRCGEVRAGRITRAEAAERLYRNLAEVDFAPPVFGFADPDDRFYVMTPLVRLRTLAWLLTKAPAEVRHMLKGAPVYDTEAPVS